MTTAKCWENVARELSTQDNKLIAEMTQQAIEAENAIVELRSKLEAAEQDAAKYEFLSDCATQQSDSVGPIFRIDIRRNSEGALFNFNLAVIAAMKESEK